MSSKWIDVSGVYHPPLNAMNYLFSVKCFLEEGRSQQEVMNWREEPQCLVDRLREYLARAKPELQGYTVMSVEFELNRYAFSMIVLHPSLPVWGEYCDAPSEWIVSPLRQQQDSAA